uniref:Protein kinase domain-containing protein n=1 Tax=viral metagenome TaxID=1070528 RepID=A0A6C0EE50_9ZZZZ
MENKLNFNLIPDRVKRIQNIFVGNNIDSIIDYKNSSESFEYPNHIDDIRELLPKKYIDFGKAISQLGGKLLYIKSGSTGHTFKGVHPPPNNENKESYAVKIVAYPKKENYGDMYNIKRPENTEILMIRLLSYFVINKQTPHIVLPITTFNTSIKPFLNLTKSNIVNNKKFEQFIEKYEKGEYYQNVSILVSEWANSGDLLDYIKKNYKSLKLKDWRCIFYQIFSVLAIIHNKYPSFRHNDMKANNILIHKIDIDKNNKKYLYKINNQTYIVPNIGFQIKLWDFDFACIPNIVDNSKVEAEWTNKINIKPEQNRYYDIHYFFNTLTRKGFFPEIFTSDDIPDKVKEFINRIVPTKYQTGSLVSDKGRLLVNDEYLLPEDVLKNDSFFKVMRK